MSRFNLLVVPSSVFLQVSVQDHSASFIRLLHFTLNRNNMILCIHVYVCLCVCVLFTSIRFRNSEWLLLPTLGRPHLCYEMACLCTEKGGLNVVFVLAFWCFFIVEAVKLDGKTKRRGNYAFLIILCWYATVFFSQWGLNLPHEAHCWASWGSLGSFHNVFSCSV